MDGKWGGSMSAAQRETPAATGADHSTINANCRIPRTGFVALRHLLDAARTLHHLPDLPDDAIQSVRILLNRIEADLIRLGCEHE